MRVGRRLWRSPGLLASSRDRPSARRPPPRPLPTPKRLQAAAGTYEALHLLTPGTRWRSALALAVAAEDPGQARQLAGRELAGARRAGQPRAAGIALRTRGMLEGGEQGLRDLSEATEVLAASGARLEHARALVEFGAALRRANQRTAARAPLRTGLDLAHRCGAVRLAQRRGTSC